VKVYANVDELQVTVNGERLPPVAGDGGVFRWPQVGLKPGENIVEARGTREGRMVQDRVVWECGAPGNLRH
jgi:beta-galactosidase